MWPPARAVTVGAPPVNTTRFVSATGTPAPKRNWETEKLATAVTPPTPYRNAFGSALAALPSVLANIAESRG